MYWNLQNQSENWGILSMPYQVHTFLNFILNFHNSLLVTFQQGEGGNSSCFFFFSLKDFLGSATIIGPNFPCPWATMLALVHLGCSFTPSNSHTSVTQAPGNIKQHSPLFRGGHPSENWLSSRCLTSVIVPELVFSSWHQPLTSNSCSYLCSSAYLSVFGPRLAVAATEATPDWPFQFIWASTSIWRRSWTT